MYLFPALQIKEQIQKIAKVRSLICCSSLSLLHNVLCLIQKIFPYNLLNKDILSYLYQLYIFLNKMNSMIEYLNNNGIPPFPSGSSFNSLFIRNLINYLKERKIDNLVIKSKN